MGQPKPNQNTILTHQPDVYIKHFIKLFQCCIFYASQL